jgi:beta-glucosidase
LRGEWKFKGIVVSDWFGLISLCIFIFPLTIYFHLRFGTYSVDGAINAGLDLEMPGPPRWRNTLLVTHCLSAQKLLVSTIDERVTNLLTFVQQQARKNPKVVFGDGIERSRDSPEGRQFCRSLAAEGIVLLKNRDNVLPLGNDKPGSLNIAVIGPNAKERVISGGGSAALKATYVVTPFQGIKNSISKGSTLRYHVGCYGESTFYLQNIK